jgi:hypothetical protein
VLQEAGGDVAGLPGNGPVSVDQQEQARTAVRAWKWRCISPLSP